MRLTTHLNLVLRLRMSCFVTLLPLYVFMARKVTTLHFPFSKPVARFYSPIVFVLSAINKRNSDKVHPRTGYEDPQGKEIYILRSECGGTR